MAAQATDKLLVRCEWVVRERRPSGWVEVLRRHNLFTNDGLTQLAGALGGGYTPPQYLVLDSWNPKLQAAYTIGATSISTDKQAHLTGDTQLVLSPGTANAEVVTFSNVTGTGPYVYTISATVNAHSLNDFACRNPLLTDTVSSIQQEAQYDSLQPTARSQTTGGYSAGTAQYTQTFFLTGTQALFDIVTVGMADNATIGAGLLHDHLALGYTHSSGNDVEIDVTLSLTNG